MKRGAIYVCLIIFVSAVFFVSCDISEYIQSEMLTYDENSADDIIKLPEEIGLETTAEEPVPVADPREALPDETLNSYEVPASAVAQEAEQPHIFTILPMIGEYKTPYHCTKHSRIFNETYHQPGVLIFYINDPEMIARFNEITLEPEKTEDCDISNQNIYEAVKLGVTREQLEEFCYGTNNYYLWDYNIEILLSGDEDAVEEYYSSSGNYAEMMDRYGILKIKLALEAVVGIQAMAKFYGDSETNIDTLVWTLANRESEWSLADFIGYFGITEDQLVDVIRSCINESADRKVTSDVVVTEGGRYVMPDSEYSQREYSGIFSRINLERLFSENGVEEIKAAEASGMRPVLVDEMICSDIEE